MEKKATTASERFLIVMERKKITFADLVQRVVVDEGITFANALDLVEKFENGKGCHIDVAAALIRIIVDRDAANARAIEAWSIVEKLRAPEGHSVTLICDNPDFGLGPNNAIEVCAEWTRWCPRRFTGDTMLDALRAAAKAAP